MMKANNPKIAILRNNFAEMFNCECCLSNLTISCVIADKEKHGDDAILFAMKDKHDKLMTRE
jgi:hypothetical protein